MSNDKKELKQLYSRIEKMYGIYIERTFATGRIKRMRKEERKAKTRNFYRRTKMFNFYKYYWRFHLNCKITRWTRH